MIRKFCESDMDRVLDIWLSASAASHDFMEASFWESQTDNMRHVHLPSSEVFVFEKDSEITGFYALSGNELAAVFISPPFQGMGMGKQLLLHARQQRPRLTLSVYKANKAGYQFYRSQGFSLIGEQTDRHTGHEEYRMST
ncbi:GNAT family N-acetyltransferase [Desulfobotulus sp. H1]|uniref:GNAT family N-acetyltransferase n=1 Tax=Desulfobotulus pelophilus TaxID=2823377 RepID=A0ABT3N7S0_9BACT|nr:GNAT family N-acetyltransferase [Desulfobotulus pelophilus]MCW7753495.1 GNAT family N-acetyltransferase [Desulfobotulus pelophilus]